MQRSSPGQVKEAFTRTTRPQLSSGATPIWALLLEGHESNQGGPTQRKLACASPITTGLFFETDAYGGVPGNSIPTVSRTWSTRADFLGPGLFPTSFAPAAAAGPLPISGPKWQIVIAQTPRPVNVLKAFPTPYSDWKIGRAIHPFLRRRFSESLTQIPVHGAPPPRAPKAVVGGPDSVTPRKSGSTDSVGQRLEAIG